MTPPSGRVAARGAISAAGRTDDRCEDGVFAALDLGTNNCRLMIAARSGNGFRVVDSYSRMVRLGEGLQQSGVLTESAMERTIEAMHVCANRLERKRPMRLRAVATEACRRASNAGAFVERVRRETGISLEIISSREEAELAVESCASLLHSDARTDNTRAVLPAPAGEAGAQPSRGLLLDIGGGSTEVAWVRLDPARRCHDVIGYVSVPVGVITLAERFSERRPGVYRAMVAHVRRYLDTFENVHQIRREMLRENVRVVGTSGTITTLASLDLDLPRYTRWAIDGYKLDPKASRDAIARLHRMGGEGMRAHPCIGPERADYVMPGCAIFDAILSLWPASVVVADRGLRDGMLLRMMREEAQLGRRASAPRRQGQVSHDSPRGERGAHRAVAAKEIRI